MGVAGARQGEGAGAGLDERTSTGECAGVGRVGVVGADGKGNGRGCGGVVLERDARGAGESAESESIAGNGATEGHRPAAETDGAGGEGVGVGEEGGAGVKCGDASVGVGGREGEGVGADLGEAEGAGGGVGEGGGPGAIAGGGVEPDGGA